MCELLPTVIFGEYTAHTGETVNTAIHLPTGIPVWWIGNTPEARKAAMDKLSNRVSAPVAPSAGRPSCGRAPAG
jgi:hypothetical protein